MKRAFTCIVCPVGCEMDAEYGPAEDIRVAGNLCAKGKAYAIQELVDPRRTISTSVRVTGASVPLVSVRLTCAVPKGRIFDVMREINKHVLVAPVHIHDIVIKNVLGLGSDVIATKNIPAAKPGAE